MKRRRNVLKQTKGFRFGRKSKERMAREALLHAGTHAYRDRKKKKSTMRQLWNIKINAAVRPAGISYSKFIGQLKKQNIALDRKILSQLAEKHSEIFSKVLEKASK